MRGDQRQHNEDGNPCTPVNVRSVHRSRCSDRPHEVETADAQGSAFNAAQFRVLEQRHDVLRVDVTMAVEMREVDQPLAERATSPMCQEPNEQIVTRGPMQNAASRRGRGSG